ncbi:MAG: ImmA/IrrE family metallo-endopeptidase [Acidiferrobacteraceae bacterium]
MFERGFKAWCETISTQYRKALGLQPTEPLDPLRLAQHLGITVWTTAQVPGLSPATLKILTKDDPSSWSAVTIYLASQCVIIHNHVHAVGRTNSNLAHELAHVIIGHKPARIDVTPDNALMLNVYDKKQESEADWLAGCLLLPRPALEHIRRSKLNSRVARETYGVSEPMYDYRVRMTGVDKQFRRTRPGSAGV